VFRPPRAEQRRIASILSAYDDLIENNSRRIQILEEMAQAIYREWFVEFRFPGHEDVRMVHSELGLIPEGWPVSDVGQIARIHRGRSYRGIDLAVAGGLPFVNLKCVARDGGFRRDGVKRYVGRFDEDERVYAGDIVVAVTDMTQERRIIARAARIPRLKEDEFGIISMDLVRLEPVEKTPREFLLGLLRFSGFPDQVKNHANGANVLHLNPKRILDYRFACPPQELCQRYGDTVAPIYHLEDCLELTDDNLRKTRDVLLPRLISGEIDVSRLDIGNAEPAA